MTSSDAAPGVTPDSTSLEREVIALRQQVTELQRRLAQDIPQNDTQLNNGIDVSIPEREALLVEAERIAHMGSWVWNIETNKVVWSYELYRILGCDPDKDTASVEAFFACIHPDDREFIQKLSAESSKTGQTPRVELRVQRKDGVVRHVQMDGAPIFDSAGNVRRFVGTVLDMTDLRRLQQRLAEAEKMEAIGRLAGGIAHDFNNLLMVVRGNLELLDAQHKPELAAIFGAVESAQTLTAGLLAFGRKSHLQRRTLDLNQLVNNTVELLGRLVGQHIVLNAVLDTELPAVDADQSLLQQALINLVINARDVLAEGGVITVRTQTAMHDNLRHVELSVTDDGPGMDAVTQSHLFEPFFTTKVDGKGSGLGLAMVHGTVTQHGGSVRVDSKPGRGSTFTLSLPAATQTPQIARDANGLRVPSNQIQHTIMVVEDQPEVATLLLNLLQRRGYRVINARRPSHALELIRQHAEINMVLCDLNMPEMHGSQLAIKLKQVRAQLPIVFMSGYSGDTAQLPANSKLLGKPFSFVELEAAIAEALNSKD